MNAKTKKNPLKSCSNQFVVCRMLNRIGSQDKLYQVAKRKRMEQAEMHFILEQ
jgi:hypothetical protein